MYNEKLLKEGRKDGKGGNEKGKKVVVYFLKMVCSSPTTFFKVHSLHLVIIGTQVHMCANFCCQDI